LADLELSGLLEDHGIQISIQGTGGYRDNVFVQRLKRSVRYEEVYLHTYGGVRAAHLSLER
jgi:putative transposase